MEKQKAVFNELVSHITELCFDKCVPKPGNKLDGSEQACLSHCALRFLESNQVVLQRLQRSK
jgi:import inner membrane translocase subunit TIM8